MWEPFARNNQIDISAKGWAYEVGQKDYSDVRESDATFAIVNGTPPDEGVMIELGMAIALGKPTFLFRDDFRRCTDSEEYPLNLMLFTGLPRDGWQDYFYTSVEEIAAPDKALARWAAGQAVAGPDPATACSKPVVDLLACPTCAGELQLGPGALRCPRGHSFDVARQGYVSLLAAGAEVGAGDTPQMVDARAAFLASRALRPDRRRPV